MTDAELHQKITGLLAGTLPDDIAAQFRAALRDSEPLREQARLMALGLLLGERSEQLDLLQKMDGWENEMSAETPADTDTARLELLLNERQDEIELRRNMDTWENDLTAPPPTDTSRRRFRRVVWPVVLLLVAALVWWWYGAPRSRFEPPPPSPSVPDTPTRQNPPPAQSVPTPPPADKHRYVALARTLYHRSAIATDNIRSAGADTLEPFRRSAIVAYESRRWPEAVRALDALLAQLAESEKPPYLLLLGGAHFEQGDFRRAIEIFSRKALSDDPEYGYDAQRYELLSRVANLPADKDALRQLIRNIRQDPDNPNRELVAEIRRKTPDL